MQTAVKSFIAFFTTFLLALIIVPFATAYADETIAPEVNEYSTEIGPLVSVTGDPQEENSYRFVNGERLSSADGALTENKGGLSTFSAIVNPEGHTVFDWFDKFSKGYYTGTNAFKGIDVSEHNGVIDWKKVKASGVDYAIIRCGYGQNSKSQDDDRWIQNVQGCIKEGIPFGVYIYSYATNATRAAGEADHVLRCLKDAGLNPSKLGYPVYFDMEDASTIGSDYAAMATAFCNKIKAAGYVPGIYANKSWFTTKLTASCFNNWTKWVAEWNASNGLTYKGLSNFTSGNGMWQFSDYGKVPGIPGHAVDLDYTFMKPKYNVGFASVTTSGMVRNATGKALSPSISVKVDGKTLKSGTDYTVSFTKDGKTTTTAPSAAGTYAVSITGTGLYSGKKSIGNMVIYAKPNIDTSFACKISSVSDGKLVLDASGKTPKVGSNVSIWTSNGGNNQVWHLEADDNGYYTIKSAANTGYVLDASGASPKNGANISVWTNNKGNNQKWILVESGGSYTLINAANNSLVLDASGATPKSGANVTAWSNNGGKNQKWTITPMNDLSLASTSATGMVRNATGQQLRPNSISVQIGGKTLKEGTDYTVLYDGKATPPSSVGNHSVTVQGKGAYKGTKSVGTMRIVAKPNLSSQNLYQLKSAYDSRFILDAANKTPHQGSNISVWTNNGGSNQKWYFAFNDNTGYYTIRNAANQDLVLDASGVSPKVGSNVSAWTKNDGLNQKWVIESSGNDTYIFRNAANPNLILDASGAKPRVGANVTAWSNNGGKNQKWTITPMNDLSLASTSATGMVRNATGQQLRPNSISVQIGGKTLKEGTDYTVLYDGKATPPSSVGNHSVTVQGKGAYKGTKSVGTMRIVAKPNLSSQNLYQLKSAYDSRFILDAANKTPHQGSNISVWTNNGGSNQKWYFAFNDNTGYYTIRNAANQDLVLDASGVSPKVGSNVSAWTKNDGLNQKWVIESSGNDTYIFRNAANPNLILDASGAKPRVGANVTAWSHNGGNNQKWKINAA